MTAWERVDRFWRAPAPPERLALVRIVVGIYCVGLLLVIGPMLLRFARLPPARFEGVGVAALLPGPIPMALLVVLFALGFAGAIGLCLGFRHRLLAPAFAALLLFLLSYRNSWGHMSHADHLVAIHVMLLAVMPAADALALDARAGRTRAGPAVRYGWPLRLLMLTVVLSYVLAGVAKLRIGGLDWVRGDAVHDHVAADALMKLRVGGFTSTVAPTMLRAPWMFAAVSVTTLVVELGAAVAMVGGRLRWAWIAAAIGMHLGIGLTMGIAFPYPLSGVAFASFFELERGWAWVRARRGRGR